MNTEEKIPELEKSSDGEVVNDEAIEVIEGSTPLSRLKQERAKKAEKKKAIKAMTAKFGDVKLAKKLVKTAVRNIQTRRTAGRGR